MYTHFFQRFNRIYLAFAAFILIQSLHSQARVNDLSNRCAGLAFTENKGQITDQNGVARHDVDYVLKVSKALSVFIGSGKISYQFYRHNENPPTPSAVSVLPGNVFSSANETTISAYRLDVTLENATKNVSSSPSGLQTGYETHYTPATGLNGAIVSSYKQIIYKNVYPKIDWVLNITGDGLKHEFVVHEGGDVNHIRLRYSGGSELKITDDGGFTAHTPFGKITEHAPYTYQKNDSKKVHSQFKLEGNFISYIISSYAGELVIDPSIDWATYYGGSESDYGQSVVTDDLENVYMVGATRSSNNIATTGSFQTILGGAVGVSDIFAAKFDKNGTRIWATYYGGPGSEVPKSVVIDGHNNIYLTGQTSSSSSMATPGAFKETSALGIDAFILKLNSAGERKWCTYFGGNSADEGSGITTDKAGFLYIAGYTTSTTMVATPGTHKSANASSSADGFLAKFDTNGARIWSTYYGGAQQDLIYRVECDALGNVYVCGQTSSLDNIATPGAHQPVFSGTLSTDGDGFLAKFNSDGLQTWATYYGGPLNEGATGLAVMPDGKVYICGTTNSPTGIATPGTHKPDKITTVGYDGYVVKFDGNGTRLWGTYYGGRLNDAAMRCTTDLAGNVFVCGQTYSDTGIATSDAIKSNITGDNDGFIAMFNQSGNRIWGSYFGGPAIEAVVEVTARNGNLYCAGGTESNSGISTASAHQPAFGGPKDDAFLVRLSGFPVSVPDIGGKKSPIFTLYPNPTNGKISIQCRQAGKLDIFHIDGSLVSEYTLNAASSDVLLPAHLPAGIYFAKFTGADGMVQIERLSYFH